MNQYIETQHRDEPSGIDPRRRIIADRWDIDDTVE